MSFLGFLISTVIFQHNKKNIFLSFYILLSSFNEIYFYYVFLSPNLKVGTTFLIHFFPLFFLNGPVLWFYIRGELKCAKPFGSRDFWHFIPFLVVLGLIVPYIFLPESVKYSVLNYLRSPNFITRTSPDLPWISVIELYKYKLILFSGYLAFCIYHVFRENKFKFRLDNPEIKWLFYLLVMIFAGNVFITASTILASIYSDSAFLVSFGSFITTKLSLVLYVFVFFHPKILYGRKQKSVIYNNATIYIPTIEELLLFEGELNKYIRSNLHLDNSFSKSRILNETGFTDRVFTFYFNEHLELNFTQWRNKHRIQVSLEMIKAGYLTTHTIESLANEIGFKSRNSFTASFKKEVGCLPSEVRIDLVVGS
jgi:AraC-like DNA-binding protein